MAVRASRQTPRWRFILDIVLLAAFSIGFGIAMEALARVLPDGGPGYGARAALLMIVIGFGWLLLRLRGERLADIGLKPPNSLLLTIALAIGVAGVLYAVALAMELAGLHRDVSRFAALEGDLALLAWMIGFAFVGAGFYEEFVFRGFVFRSFAGAFGDGRRAWIVAAVLQAVLFAGAHGYQGWQGMAFTGGAALVVALVVLAAGRNLWPAILGHALFDAARFTQFYLQGTG